MKTQLWATAAQKKASVILASNDPKVFPMFANKTLAQVAMEHDLPIEAVEWYHGKNPNNGQAIESVLVTIEGITYQISLSRGWTPELLDNQTTKLNGVFRAGYKQLVIDGLAQKYPSGKPILNDGEDDREFEPYMSFGKPSGITLLAENREQMFEEEDVTALADTNA